MYFKFKIILILIFIISCQPIEIIDPVKFDYSNFEKIYIDAKEVSINDKYQSIFSEDNIEDQIENPPINLIKGWINKNVRTFGNENKLVIDIIDASILRKEIENKNANKYEEKLIYKYEVFFLIEYKLLDNSNYILANTTVESVRSTTSQKYISLNESELIINDLLYSSLKDFTNETKSLIDLYMGKYIQ